MVSYVYMSSGTHGAACFPRTITRTWDKSSEVSVHVGTVSSCVCRLCADISQCQSSIVRSDKSCPGGQN